MIANDERLERTYPPNDPDSEIEQWTIRIVGFEFVNPLSLLFAPDSLFIHPYPQQLTLEGVLKNIGWLKPLIVNSETNHLIDGRARAERAAANHQKFVPVIYVKLPADLEPVAAIFINGTAKQALWDNQLPYYENDQGEKVFTSTLSKVDETVRAILAGKGLAKRVMQGLLKLGVVKTGEDSRSRTAARKTSIEHLKEIQYQCKRHGKAVFTVDKPGLGSVRVYGNKDEVESFLNYEVGGERTRVA